MAKLPDDIHDSPTVRAIYAAYEAKADKPRRYVGASQIGKPCSRALWYDFRWAGHAEFPGRMLRLFQTGNLEEIRVIHNLREIGCEVHEKDQATGEQFSVTAVAGHFGGHMDGCILGVLDAPKTWHVLEVKTASAKYFKQISTKGVQEAKPEHWAQMQAYMHLSGMDRSLYIVVNKDTDELYAERIRYEKAEGERIIAKAQAIVASATPPERIADAPDKFPCVYCSHQKRCFPPLPDDGGPAVPWRVTCRSCCHVTPQLAGTAGEWKCEKHAKLLSEGEQERGCQDHLFIPDLITFAKAEDTGADWILYKLDGHQFVNSTHAGAFTSSELTQVTVGGLRNPLVNEVKQRLGGVVVGDFLGSNSGKS